MERDSHEHQMLSEEYTFTDRELESILSFLEAQNKPGAKIEQSTLPTIPPMLGQGSPKSIASQLPMQFQPHSVPSSNAPMQQAFAVKQEQPSGVHVGPQLMHFGLGPQPTLPSQSIPQMASMMAAPSVTSLPVYHQALSMKELYNPATHSAGKNVSVSSMTPALSSKQAAIVEKGGVSHSTVEKQRRDRINNLIDELRDLVPPQLTGSGPAENGDVKRPKHVVLSDTIALLKKLQAQIPLQMESIANQRRMEDVLEESSDSQGLLGLQFRSQDGGARSSSKDRMNDLPMPPKNQSANGIVVEESQEKKGVMLVKVNCKDRRGLLSDVIGSLRSLDLEIKTAAITTTNDGTVHDVFEVIPHPDVSAEDIQCQVHSSVYNRLNTNEKRMRPTE